MPYDQIVFIGYVIDTSAGVDPSTGKPVYPGLPDPAGDIAARCQLMLAAMQQAKAMLPPQASPPVSRLNVFMAPEFFFRGPTGAYSMDDVQVAINTLQEIAADPEWDDWLFEFGTIAGNYEDPYSNPPTQICNFALVQQGGAAAQGPDGARAIVKELMSGVDFVADSANPGALLLGAVTHAEAAGSGPGTEQQLVAYDGAGIFPMVGLNWAVEICRDHLLGRLQSSPQLPGAAEVQVQLVPSCGGGVDNDNVIAQADGYVFGVDGDGGQSHAGLYQSGPPLTAVARIACTAVNVTSVVLDGYSPPVEVQVRTLFNSGAGAIWLYEPVDAPQVRYVLGWTLETVPPWAASADPDWVFTFYLIYDENGNFSTALCKIRSNALNFYGNNYELPLSMTLTFPPIPPDTIARTGTIDISLKQGGNGYDHGIYGTISVPGFAFQGEIMQFMTAKDSPKKAQLIWQADLLPPGSRPK